MRALCISFVFAFLYVMLGPHGQAGAQQKMQCQSHKFLQAHVLAVKDNGTLLLSTGQQVRLDAVLLPLPPAQFRKYKTWPIWQEAVSVLQALLVGQSVTVHIQKRKTDRYGRILGHVYKREKEENVWVQKYLIEKGLAWVFPFQKNAACAQALLQLEQKARQAKTGLWQHEIYRIRSAQKPVGMIALANKFQLVRGRVHTVAKVRNKFYLNFEKDWRRDFTVLVSKRLEKRLQQHGVDISNLKDKCIRVRGWIKIYNGPMIEMVHPLQLELLEKC